MDTQPKKNTTRACWKIPIPINAQYNNSPIFISRETSNTFRPISPSRAKNWTTHATITVYQLTRLLRQDMSMWSESDIKFFQPKIYCELHFYKQTLDDFDYLTDPDVYERIYYDNDEKKFKESIDQFIIDTFTQDETLNCVFMDLCAYYDTMPDYDPYNAELRQSFPRSLFV